MAYYRCKSKSKREPVSISASQGNGINSSNGHAYNQDGSMVVPTLGYKYADISGGSNVGTGNNIDVSAQSSISINVGNTTSSVTFHN